VNLVKGMKADRAGTRLSAMLLLSTALSALAAGPVHAQDVAAADVSEDGNDIVVTAQKRAQRVQDIGLSITAIGADDLRRLQANDVSTLATQVPNVVATSSANLPAFTIRGVGLNEFASNFDSPVAIHIDEVYKSKPYMASMPFFDLDRVEALKGPQGTLFGRNTTGGSVNFYTAEPKQETSGAFNLSGDQYGRVRLDGAFNTALTDQLAARFSYFVAQGSGGPYRNLFDGKDYGAPNQMAGRFQLKWTGDSTTIKVAAYGFRDKSELTPYKSPGIYDASGALCPQLLSGNIDDNRGACLKYGAFVPAGNTSGLRETQSIRELNSDKLWLANNSSYGTSLRIQQDLGGADLISITSYDYFQRDQTEDGDNSPTITVNEDFYSRIKQFTQELRIAGKTGQLNYMVGGFFERDSIDEANSANFLDNPLIGLPPAFPRFGAAFTQKVRSLALFTHNEYALTPTLSVIAGIRYTNDRTSLDGATFLGANDPVGKADRITPVVPVAALVDKRTDENISFRGGLNWKFVPDHMAYASVSRGFRSGGYSVPFGGIITTFSPERLTAYEIGYKGRLLDRTLDINLAAFRYDYNDLQANVDDPASPIVPITRNIGSSRTYGVEGDLTWRPDRSVIAKVGIGYLDAEVRKSDRFVTTYAGPVALEGKRPVNTPKWTVQAFLQKSFPISPTLEIIAQTDGKYTGSRYLESTGQVFDRAEGYWVQNARLALAAQDGRWELAVWGKNIFNKEYLTYINNVSFFRLEIYGEPVSYGLSASVKF
jgi:iron complex outermembrane receptor protein